MTNSLLLNFLLAFLLPMILGQILIKLLRFSCPLFVRLSLSLFLGLGVVSLWMLFLLMAKVSLTLLHVVLPLCMMGILGLVVCQFLSFPISSQKADIKREIPHFTFPFFIFIFAMVLFIAYQIYFVFQLTLLLPISTWDGIYAIAVKAKYFFYGGHLAGLKNFFITSSYPIQVELCLAWVAIVFNQWDDQWIKLIFPVMLIAHLFVQYDFVKSFSNRWRALLACALTLCSYFVVYHATIEYRSIFFLIYNLLPVFLIFRFFKNDDSPALILSGIFAGMSTFVKLEGTGHILIYLVLILYMLWATKEKSWRKTMIVFLKFGIPVLLFCLPFWLVKKTYHLGSFEGRLNLEVMGFWERILPIVGKLLHNLFLSGNWSILWAVLVIFILTSCREVLKSLLIKYLGLTLFLYFSLYIVLGLFTSTFTALYSYSDINLSRAILHFFPLCPIMIALLI